jgi:hypothetical protein
MFAMLADVVVIDHASCYSVLEVGSTGDAAELASSRLTYRRRIALVVQN